MFRVLIILSILCSPCFAKEYNGSTWGTTTAKRYTGSAWADVSQKYYSGSAWVDITEGGGGTTYKAYVVAGNNNSQTAYSATDTVGQTFVSAYSGTLKTIKVTVNSIGDGTGTLYARIGNTCDVTSSYIAEASNTVALSSTGEKSFTFTSGTLTQGNTYCFVVRNPNALYVARADIALFFSATSGGQAYASGAGYYGDDWNAGTALGNYRDITGAVEVQ